MSWQNSEEVDATTVSNKGDQVDAQIKPSRPKQTVHRSVWSLGATSVIFTLLLGSGIFGISILDKQIPRQGFEGAPLPQVSVSEGLLTQVCPPAVAQSLDSVINPDGSVVKPSIVSGFASSNKSVSLDTLAGKAINANTLPLTPFEVSTTTQQQTFMAARSDQIVTSDFDSLSSASCQRAQRITWLSGGATELGNSSDLVLVNPAPSSTSVTIAGWSEKGVLPSFPVVSIAGHSTRRIKLSGLGMAHSALTLRVETEGAPVAAFLATQRGNGLISHGAEWSPQIREPKREQVLVGIDLSVTGGKLLLTNPGTENAVASVSVVGQGEPSLVPGADQVTVPAQSILELDLGGIDIGVQALSISASKPLLATVMSVYSRTEQSSELVTQPLSDSAMVVSDYALLGPSEAITESSLLVPRGLSAEALLTNLGRYEVTVSVGSRNLRVPALSTLRIPLTHSEELQATGKIYGALKFSRPNTGVAVSILPLRSNGSSGADVTLDWRP